MTEQLIADGFEVTVAESPHELRYTFANPGRPHHTTQLAGTFWWFNVILAGTGAAVAYALLTAGPGRPAWVLALSWLFVGQTLVMALLGLQALARRRLLALAWGRKMMEMVFTRDAFLHQTGSEHDGPVCSLAEVRGFRVFTSANDQPPPERYGALSVVVGDGRHTHGIFGGCTAEEMVNLANHLHRRLSAFRRARGLKPLDPVEVIETTEEEAARGSHTLPARPRGGLVRQLAWQGWWALVLRPRLFAVWCAGVFAGLVGSGWLLVAAGLPAVLFGLLFIGLIHAALLVAAWKFLAGPQPPG